MSNINQNAIYAILSDSVYWDVRKGDTKPVGWVEPAKPNQFKAYNVRHYHYSTQPMNYGLAWYAYPNFVPNPTPNPQIAPPKPAQILPTAQNLYNFPFNPTTSTPII